MPKFRVPYPREFRRQMVELVRSGRTSEELSREFEPTAQSIWNWVRQAERDGGARKDGGVTSRELEELSKLRRENHCRSCPNAWCRSDDPWRVGRRVRRSRRTD
jgi:transposase